MERVFRKEGSEVAFDCNGADTWAAAAVRDTESFVEVKVGDIATELTGFSDSDECVEVCTIDVDLSADAMDFLADGADTFLKDPVGRRVGDHDRGDFVAIAIDFLIEIIEVYIALGIALHDNDLHVRHLSASWICAVSGARDQADVSVGFTARSVVLHDGEKSSIFAL